MICCNTTEKAPMMDLYFKGIRWEPQTEYCFSFEVYGGEFIVFFNENRDLSCFSPAGDPLPNVFFSETTTAWQRLEWRLRTGKDAAEMDFLRDWGISFVKRADQGCHFSACDDDTLIRNLSLYRLDQPERELITGGTFSEPTDSVVYRTNWSNFFDGQGKELGVERVRDPLDGKGYCLKLPAVLRSLVYPKAMTLQADSFGVIRGEPWDVLNRSSRGKPYCQLILVHRGALQVSVAEKAQNITANGVLYLPPKTPFRMVYTAGEETDYAWVHFTGTAARSLMDSCGLSRPAVLSVPHITALIRWVEQMLKLMPRNPMQFCELSGYLQLMLGELERQRRGQEVFGKYAGVLDAVAEELRTHPERAYANADLAERCGMCESYFIRSFSQRMGETPLRYRRRALIQKACWLLQNTTMTVQEISFSLGIDDPLYFSRLFRTEQGVSPRDFRKRT